MSFSKIFGKQVRTDMGLLLVTCLLSSALRTGVTSETFSPFSNIEFL